MLKLHLGSGAIDIPGYVNVDISPHQNVTVVADLRILPFAEDCADLIYSCACIEHFGRREWRDVLKHWFSVLKPGGLLRVSTADFKAAIARYQDVGDLEELLGLLIGGQKDPYDWHGMIFDYETLADGLETSGFRNVRRYDWRDTEVAELGIDDYSQAYLPHMDKECGRLMVLNLEADKPH